MAAVVLVGVGGGDDADAQPTTCQGKTVTIFASPGEVTQGTPGDDVIMGTNGPDVIRARGGNDTICARGGNDRVFGGPGNDVIVLGGGDDVGRGGPGRDRILGNRGDTLVGGPGNDWCVVRGGAGTIRSCERPAQNPGDPEPVEPVACESPAPVGTTCRLVAPALGRQLDITLRRVVDPARPADDVGPGGRLVAVLVDVRNTGSGEWSRGTFGVSLVDANGTTHPPAIVGTAEGASFGRPTIAEGRSSSGWITFDVPMGVDLQRLRWSECCDATLNEVSVAWSL